MNAAPRRKRRHRTAEGDDGLTAPQREVLLLVATHLLREGRPPTMKWLMLQTGILGLNGITFHLRVLARKGAIDRDFKRANAIRLCGCTLRLECDVSAAGRRLARLLGHDEGFEQGGGI